MYLLRLRTVVPTAVIATLVAIFGIVGLTKGTTPALPPASISDLQLAELRITNPVEVPDVDVNATPGGATITRAQAIAIATARVGRTDSPSGVYRASAPRYMDEPNREVWVVLFNGGDAPFDGPSPGIGPMKMRLTGVIIDDQTGEVLRWFMI